jgi:regulator of protease activity HflC (stomatin/prohibitin superfamily)
MDARTRPRTVKTQTASKGRHSDCLLSSCCPFSHLAFTSDLQNVNLSLRVLSKPEEKYLPEIYQTLSLDYDERVLPSMVNEVLKGTVAQYNADQLLTQRDEVSSEIRRNLKDRLTNFHILLDDVSIVSQHALAATFL